MTDTFIDLKNALIFLKILLKFLIEFQDLFFIIILFKHRDLKIMQN